MKKKTLFIAVIGLAVAAHAQIKGLGYDATLKQAQLRLGIGENRNIDFGLGFLLYTGDSLTTAGTKAKTAINPDGKFTFSASAFFLQNLMHWGPVSNYAAGGLVLQQVPGKDNALTVNVFGGIQPEVTLLDHIVLSTRFGIDIPVLPDFYVQTEGSGISVVGASSFKIVW